jgi:hypothetical protein
MNNSEQGEVEALENSSVGTEQVTDDRVDDVGDQEAATIIQEKPVTATDQFVPDAVEPRSAREFTGMRWRFLAEIVPDVVSEQTEMDADVEFLREIVHGDDLPAGHPERGAVLTHKSGVQVYVGRDSTAHARNNLFAFVTYDGKTGARVETAEEALDLLKPDPVVGLEADEVVRQGEWFLFEDGEPMGSTQKPGVRERPYGASPLDSHIPREWATGVPDMRFMGRVHDRFSTPDGVRSPQDVFEWLDDVDASDQMVETVRGLADGLFVKGSFRHEDNEHFIETVEGGWHRAETHEWDVMTVEAGEIVLD